MNNNFNNIKSLDELIEDYRNGYTLNEMTDLRFLGSCISQIPKGTVKDINLTVTNPGTPPYTYKTYRDNILIDTYGPVNDTTHKISHKFDEPVGQYTMKIELVDSCNKVVSDTCTVNIIEEGGGGGGGSMGIVLLGLVAVAGAVIYGAKGAFDSPPTIGHSER